MENKTNKKLYSIQDVADAIGLGHTSIYKAIKEGKLVAKKFGSKSLVTAESLDAFISQLPEKPKAGGKND